MSHDHVKNELKDRIDRTEGVALQCMDINHKANTAMREEDFGLFTKAELARIADLSASRATVLRRELREYRAELTEMIDYIDALSASRIEQ